MKAPVTEPIDREALRARYRAERYKRLRDDGNDQYIEPTGRFAHFLDDPYVKQVPVPQGVRCVLVHPHMVLATREARAILRRDVPLSDVIWQQANLAGFLAGCYTDDLPLIRQSLLDVLIEPQRQSLIPGFAAVKQAALEAGALGCSISGAGPTVFAWTLEAGAAAVRSGMVAAFHRHGLDSDAWISAIDREGARVVDG